MFCFYCTTQSSTNHNPRRKQNNTQADTASQNQTHTPTRQAHRDPSKQFYSVIDLYTGYSVKVLYLTDVLHVGTDRPHHVGNSNYIPCNTKTLAQISRCKSSQLLRISAAHFSKGLQALSRLCLWSLPSAFSRHCSASSAKVKFKIACVNRPILHGEFMASRKFVEPSRDP